MTDDDKEQLTLQALGILREQVEARVVHYKAELETSAELDAVTAAVVRQIQELQAAAVREHQIEKDPQAIENAHIATLTKLLKTILIEDKSNISRLVQPIGKRLAKLFFETELHAKSEDDKDKLIYYPEQGLSYVLKRYQNRLRAELEGFDYVSPEVQTKTLGMLAKMERDLQVAFLSRRSPELNRAMSIFTAVLVDFFHKHLPPRLSQMAKLTIRNAKTAVRPDAVPYKIRPDCFSEFRSAWERVLMTQMIHYCGDEVLARAEESEEEFREETINFFVDPHVYSETLDVLCGDLYDKLCMEGFLDLPVNWRVQMNTKD